MTETVDPSRTHAQAIHHLIDQAWPHTVYFGSVTPAPATLTYPYIVVWPPPVTRNAVNLTATVSDAYSVTQISAVGEAVDDVLAALDRAATALQGVRPVLPGRSAGLIYQVSSNAPVTPDDSTRTAAGRPVFRGVALYELTSTPAPIAA